MKMKSFTATIILTLGLSGSADLALASDAGAPTEAALLDAGAPEVAAPAQPDTPDPAPVEAKEGAEADQGPTPAEKVEDDPLGSATELVGHIREGNWRMASSLALAFLMFLIMKFRDRIKWFGTDRGAAVLVMVLSLAGGLSTSLAAGLPINLNLAIAVVGGAWTAAGSYHWFRSVFFPKDKKPKEA